MGNFKKYFSLNEENKKYELTTEKKNGLYRIRALKSFGDVKEGDLGGWINSEKNLSQNGNCWIYDNARVFDNAKIFDNAKVYDNAEISERAKVFDNTEVYGNAIVYYNAEVFGDAKVYGNAQINYHVYSENISQ